MGSRLSRSGGLRATVAIVALLALACAAGASGGSSSDWSEFRFDPNNSGVNPNETMLNVGNVASLIESWSVPNPGGSSFRSSAAVSKGVLYVGREGLYAFSATGASGCAGTPKVCTPLWTGSTGVIDVSSPTVADGTVYVGSLDANLYAFDAAGINGCSGTPKTCNPLWTAPTGAVIESSPTVVNGIVYVGSHDGNLYAFDAAGTTSCSGSPKVCTPLWTAPTDRYVISKPAVSNGIVYVGSGAARLYAFDATGTVNCSGSPKVCAPLWTGPTNGSISSSPAVVGGIAYIGSDGGHVYAFDAAGVNGCSGTPTVCTPLWTGSIFSEVRSSPAVANDQVIVGSSNGRLYAFDAGGSTGCSGAPKFCTPIWQAITGGEITSSPALANGVVYVGSGDRNVYAYDAAGVTGCSEGAPRTCTPLWTAATPDVVSFSSPAVVGGRVYVSSLDALHAYALPGADSTPPELTVPDDFSVPATSPAGATVNYSATATDDVDGSVVPTCSPPPGSVFPINAVHTATTVTCVAEDAAGNQASASFKVHVKGGSEQVTDLQALITSYGLGTLGTSLNDKLTTVQRMLAANKTNQACSSLDAFLNQVNAQTGKALSQAQAPEVRLAAVRIKNAVGC